MHRRPTPWTTPYLTAALAVYALQAAACHWVFPFSQESIDGAAGDSRGGEARLDGVPGDGGACQRAWCEHALPQATVSSIALHSVWGNGDELVVVGDNGVALHFDGATWQTKVSGTDQSLYGIGAESQARFYACGEGGTLVLWDKDHFSTPWPSWSAPGVSLSSISSDGAGSFYAVGFAAGSAGRHDAYYVMKAASSTAPTSAEKARSDAIFYGAWASTVHGLHVAGVDEAAGWSGLITRKTPFGWVPHDLSKLSPAVPGLMDIWGSGSGELHAVGEQGAILFNDGQDWSWSRPPAAGRADLWAVTGVGSDVFVAGDDGTVLHKVNGSWTDISTPRPRASDAGARRRFLLGVWASAKRIVVVGHDGPDFHSPGQGIVLWRGR